MMEEGGGESWQEHQLLSHTCLESNPYWYLPNRNVYRGALKDMHKNVPSNMLRNTLTWKQHRCLSAVEWKSNHDTSTKWSVLQQGGWTVFDCMEQHGLFLQIYMLNG